MMEVKKRSSSNGTKLLSVIDRLCSGNGNKILQTTGGNTLNDDKCSNLRKRRKPVANKIDRINATEENRTSIPDDESNSQAKNFKYSLKLLNGNCMEELSKVTKSKLCPPVSAQSLPVPVSVQLTLKPGVPNGVEPSLCFCKPPHTAQIKGHSINQRKESGLDPRVVSEEIYRTSVSQCTTNPSKIDDKQDQDGISNAGAQLKDGQPQKLAQVAKRSSICGICLMVFPSVLSLRKHQKEKGHYLCSECGEALQDDAVLREHVNKKLCRKLVCVFCGQKFATHEEVEDHKATVHHKCTECNELYKTAEKLLVHKERHHAAPYICLQCGKEFPSHDSCKKHALNRHTKRFYCPECGRGFTRMNILKRHTAYTHSKERNFKCEICLKTFKRPDALKIHLINHSDNKPFQCENCGKQFTQKICLTKHLPNCGSRGNHAKSKNSDEVNSLTENLKNVSEDNQVDRTELERSSSVIKERNERSVDAVFLGCRCPPSCSCKKFSIGLQVEREKPKSSMASVEEVASLPCCCTSDQKFPIDREEK